jgi:hypothetical protein
MRDLKLQVRGKVIGIHVLKLEGFTAWLQLFTTFTFGPETLYSPQIFQESLGEYRVQLVVINKAFSIAVSYAHQRMKRR